MTSPGERVNRRCPSVDGAWYGWGPCLRAPDCATGALEKITSMIHERFLREVWYRRETAGSAGDR